MCVIRNTLFNYSCLILTSLLCSGASSPNKASETYLNNRISKFSKIADEKMKEDLKDSGEEGKLIGKTGLPTPSSKRSDEEETDEGDKEEPNPPGVTQRPIDTEEDSGDLDSPPPAKGGTLVAKPSKPSSSSSKNSSFSAPLNIKSGTAEPEIVFPGK